jgi:hypothetical protein
MARVTDPAGRPVVGERITFTLTSQPGAGSALSATNVTSNAAGEATATLNVGPNSGTIIVSTTAGILSCGALVTLERVAEVQSITIPPRTGDGGLATTRSADAPLVVAPIAFLIFVLARQRALR